MDPTLWTFEINEPEDQIWARHPELKDHEVYVVPRVEALSFSQETVEAIYAVKRWLSKRNNP